MKEGTGEPAADRSSVSKTGAGERNHKTPVYSHQINAVKPVAIFVGRSSAKPVHQSFSISVPAMANPNT